MDVCVENVFVAPAIEEINLTPAIAEVESREASFKPQCGSQDKQVPRYKAAEQETAAQSPSRDPGASASPAGSSETPRTETAAEKNPWSAWAWLGLCRTRTEKNLSCSGAACCATTKGVRIPNIVHVEVDAFFASVEQVLNPKLRGKPVLVGRGVVASASHEAKFRGVRTAMSFREALRICPKAVVVPGQYEHYAEFAERVRQILETYTPAVETAALDDFYLNFAGTERLYPDYEAMLRRLQAEIFGRTGLNVSVGAARTKVVAAIASRLDGPRGFRMIAPGEEERFLTPLPVEKLHGIGHLHAGALAERGIATIGQLRQVPKPALQAAFGEAIGQQIWQCARGLDGREVLPSGAKSISREMSIEGGTIDTEFLGGLIEYLSERIGYVDHFSTHQTVRLSKPTNDERELLAAAKELFGKLFARRAAVRMDMAVCV